MNTPMPSPNRTIRPKRSHILALQEDAICCQYRSGLDPESPHQRHNPALMRPRLLHYPVFHVIA